MMTAKQHNNELFLNVSMKLHHLASCNEVFVEVFVHILCMTKLKELFLSF